MLKKFTLFDTATGQVLYGGTAADPFSLANKTQSVLLNSEYSTGYLDANLVHHEQPKQPSLFHVFNWQTKKWEDSRALPDFKDAQWELIKQARSQAEYGGFTWDSSFFDSDAISQNRITSAVTLAQSDAAFSVVWVLADNSVRTLNQTDMLAVGAALGQHVALQFNKSIALREAIKTATNAAQLAAIKGLN